ncbi:hypothetical protein ACHAPX_004737 [Trichoderma viride]|jgi:hypothetical protein
MKDGLFPEEGRDDVEWMPRPASGEGTNEGDADGDGDGDGDGFKKRPQIEIYSKMETGRRLENHKLRIDAATDYVYLHSLFTRKPRLQMVD